MAGLKKPAKKRDNTNPNTVLVVFLVLFVLTSLGAGIAAYYGYAEQEKLKKAAVDKSVAAKAAQEAEAYFAYIGRELRQSVGDNLDADELAAWKLTRADFMNDDGKYKDEKTRKPVKDLVDAMKGELGFDNNPDAPKYLRSYKSQIAALNKQLNEAKGTADAAKRAAEAADRKFQTLNAMHDAFRVKAQKGISDGAAISLAASKAKYKEMGEAIAENTKLRDELQKTSDRFVEEKEKLVIEKNKILKQLVEMEKLKKDANVANPRAQGQEMHALLLDMSGGKPLWDSPIGKITRVETQNRQVVINLGAADGAKPDLTFNIFAAGWNGRADRGLKGTIEVIRVMDNNTSVARITSLYDTEGKEIILNDPGRGRVQRESENPIKEGDLLFNVFWGTHVALTGKISWSEATSESPAEQMRNLNQYMQLLQRQGVIIDAYLDLTDGTVKGAITARTRFLIRGQKLYKPRPEGEKEPMDKKEGGDKAEKAEKADKADKAEPKAAEPKGEDKEGAKAVGLERVDLVNAAINAMRDEAVERGMFIISAENYANVVGFRPPRSATRVELSSFRPSIPSASTRPVLVVPGKNPPPAEDKEK